MEHALGIPSGSIVELKYELREEDHQGQLLEVMSEQWPFCFLLGSGKTLPAFDDYISALDNGSRFQFLIPAQDAYGPLDPSQILQVFRDEIEEDHRYPMENYEEKDLITLTRKDGSVIAGRIKELKAKYILIDCNHALAGKDLYFSGQILNVRKAREEELL